MNLPILYSFRRCPYAIRARMAISYSQTAVELREVVLKDKPAQLLEISPKATVPVMQLSNGQVLEESIDIMHWALEINDPQKIHLTDPELFQQDELILENDNQFKQHLDHYKYADRFPEHDAIYYRKKGEIFLKKLDNILKRQDFLMDNKLTVIDLSIFPFIRQFAHVDKAWFDQSQYKHLQKWLSYFLTSDIFISVMYKFDQWKPEDESTVFPIIDSINIR